jgi:hypothetical protein
MLAAGKITSERRMFPDLVARVLAFTDHQLSISMLDVTTKFSKNSSDPRPSYGQMQCPGLPGMGDKTPFGAAWVIGCPMGYPHDKTPRNCAQLGKGDQTAKIWSCIEASQHRVGIENGSMESERIKGLPIKLIVYSCFKTKPSFDACACSDHTPCFMFYV